MKRLIDRTARVVVMVLALGAVALAQTPQLIDLGAQPSFAWDHDGVNTTHYRFYLQTGTGTPAQVGTDLVKPTVAGTVEMIYPVKFSTEGTFTLYVSALNKSADPNVNSSESPRSVGLPIQIKKATLPTPSTPLNIRLVVKVAADGRVEFYVASVNGHR